MTARITTVGLLTLLLCGCIEDSKKSGDSPKGRTGSVGITSQGIDDLAKPDPKPNQARGKYDPGAN